MIGRWSGVVSTVTLHFAYRRWEGVSEYFCKIGVSLLDTYRDENDFLVLVFIILDILPRFQFILLSLTVPPLIKYGSKIFSLSPAPIVK